MFGQRVRVQHRAFTLVELLVVIVIIGILAALLFPAIQAMRGSARTAACSSNLRQIGFAVQGFNSVHRVYPASGWTQAGPGNPAGKFVGWRPLILPFVEQSNLHRLYDFSENWWEGTNPAAAAVSIPLFECPSVPLRSPVTSAVAHPPRPAMNFASPVAPTDYEAIMGVQPASINLHYATPRYDASNRYSVMHRNSQTRLSDITDGAAQTIIIVECGGRPDVYRNADKVDGLSNDQGIGWADSEGPFSLDLTNVDGSSEGGGPADGCFYPMNHRNDNEPYSFHSGGGNFLYADGHTSFLSESIDWETMVQLVTRAGEEVVAQLP